MGNPTRRGEKGEWLKKGHAGGVDWSKFSSPSE